MTPTYSAKLNLSPKATNIGTKKIDSSALKNYKITIARFLVVNKLK